MGLVDMFGRFSCSELEIWVPRKEHREGIRNSQETRGVSRLNGQLGNVGMLVAVSTGCPKRNKTLQELADVAIDRWDVVEGRTVLGSSQEDKQKEGRLVGTAHKVIESQNH